MLGTTKFQCQKIMSFNAELINTLNFSTQNGWQLPHQQDFHTQPSGNPAAAIIEACPLHSSAMIDYT